MKPNNTKVLPTVPESVLRQKLEWMLNPMGYLEKNQKRFPDLFESKSGFFAEKVVYVIHPEALRQIFSKDRQQFSAPGEAHKMMSFIAGESSVVCLSGEEHKRRRELLAPAFHGERLIVYGDLITQITEEVMAELSPGQSLLGCDLTRNITLRMIIKIVFGIYQGERYQKIRKLFSSMVDLFDSPVTAALILIPDFQKDFGSWSPWGRFIRQRQEVDDIIYQEIRERRENPDPDRTDILSLLMSAHYEDGTSLSDQELRDELMNLLLAGHETTANTLAWGLYWVHYLPEVKDKLMAELSTLKEKLEPLEVSKLTYFSAFCNEVLRTSPISFGTFTRVVQEPVNLLEYHLEPGTIVLGCMPMTHQREDLYPNPKQFKPERFLERKYSPYEFMPFGQGARRCVGAALAMFELKLAIAHILCNYELTLVDQRPEKIQRKGLGLRPGRGVKMIFKGKK